jgi:hypothetical protein
VLGRVEDTTEVAILLRFHFEIHDVAFHRNGGEHR